MSTLLRLCLPAAAFALWLTGCAVVTPPEGVSQADGGGIDAVIARFGVPQPEPSAGLPLLPAIVRALARSDPAQRLAGTTYSLETGNRLPRDWLVQTPNMWDQPAAAAPSGHSDALLARISRLVASAQRAVDITLLQPPADFRFLDALRKAVMQLAQSGRRVTIRILIG